MIRRPLRRVGGARAAVSDENARRLDKTFAALVPDPASTGYIDQSTHSKRRAAHRDERPRRFSHFISAAFRLLDLSVLSSARAGRPSVGGGAAATKHCRSHEVAHRLAATCSPTLADVGLGYIKRSTEPRSRWSPNRPAPCSKGHARVGTGWRNIPGSTEAHGTWPSAPHSSTCTA